MILVPLMRWLGHGLRRAQTLPGKRGYGGHGPLQLVLQSGRRGHAAKALQPKVGTGDSPHREPPMCALLPAHRCEQYQTVAMKRAVRWRVAKTTHPDSMHAMRSPLNSWGDSQNHRADSTREFRSATDAGMTEDADALDEPR